MTDTEIRPPQARDADALARVADATGLFPGEMMPDMIAGHLDGSSGEIWLAAEQNGTPVGFCFARPEPLADGTWNMLALAVAPDAQRAGLGARLVEALEQALTAHRARILIVDTSGDDAFEGARAFYDARGYGHEARIRDYWAAGDDKVTFRKALG